MIDKSEIIISFRSAKDKERQIKVLSDLNCVSPREIADILDEAGELKKVGLNAKTFSSVYHAVPAAKSPQGRAPKATRKRSGSVEPFDESRATELFNEGLDDLAIAEALGVSKNRIQQWRSRIQLYRPRGGARTKELPEITGSEQPGLTVGSLFDLLRFAQKSGRVLIDDKPARFFESSFRYEAGGEVVHELRLWSQ